MGVWQSLRLNKLRDLTMENYKKRGNSLEYREDFLLSFYMYL